MAWFEFHTVTLSKKHLTGLALIVAVALIWIAASFLVQALVTPQPGSRTNALHPFVLTYICNSLFLIYLPISAAQERKCTARRSAGEADSERNERPSDDQAAGDGELVHLAAMEVSSAAPALPARQLRLLGGAVHMSAHTWRVVKAAAVVAPIWFFAQLCFNFSLATTSVTSNTILSSPASLFTLLLSVLVLKEKFTAAKLLAVLLTIAGTVLVATADGMASSGAVKHHEAVLGDMLALLAAALYAGYTVALRVMMPDEMEGDMMAFFGYMGLMNAATFAPVLLALQGIGAVHLWSIPRTVLGLALIKGLFDNALSDYLWSKAIILVGPTIATVGLSLQVPIAMVVEPLLYPSGWWSDSKICTLELLGAAGILSGFFTINADCF